MSLPRVPGARAGFLGVVPQELVFDPFFTVRETLAPAGGLLRPAAKRRWIDEVMHH